MMELTFECPECHRVGSVSPVESSTAATCRSCGHARDLRREAIDAEGLHACPLCMTEDLYVQKDFPQGLGLVIVVAGFVVSTVFWYYDRPVPALSVLLVSALADMVLFYLVPDVTICYRCLSQYRGEKANVAGRFKAFDLAVGERYRQERMRVEQLRGRPTTYDPTTPPS
jgi:ribosomal protein L40E